MAEITVNSHQSNLQSLFTTYRGDRIYYQTPYDPLDAYQYAASSQSQALLLGGNRFPLVTSSFQNETLPSGPKGEPTYSRTIDRLRAELKDWHGDLKTL